MIFEVKKMTTQELRLTLQRIIHEKNISWDIWSPIQLYIALEETEKGNELAKEVLTMLEDSATEDEIYVIAKDKYGIFKYSQMTEDEIKQHLSQIAGEYFMFMED